MDASTKITFGKLFEELDQYDHRVPLDHLVARLKCLETDWDQIDPFVKFARNAYRRNLMRVGPAYHALILCWRSGQRSPIHDHRGSSCAVRVLSGTCTETLFGRTPDGQIFPTRTHELAAGRCCGGQDDDVHQISNLGPGNQELITLHIYSPPLLVMGRYSLTNAVRSEFVEPSYFLDGAGI
jgi:cysteine dioxygenase